MANEILYSGVGADSRATSILSKEIHRMLVDQSDLRSTLVEIPFDAMGSAAIKVPKLQFDDAMSAPGEVTQASNVALGSGNYALTVAHYTLVRELSDLYVLTGGGLDIELIAQDMVKAVKTIPDEPFKFTMEAFGF